MAEAGNLRYCQINDNIMKLAITYAELQEYVASHYHKNVNLGYVNESTVSVSVPIKVLGFTKQISINIIVKKIEGTALFLSYEGKMGIEMLVTPAVSFAKKLVPEKSDWIEVLADNVIRLRLGDIDKLQKAFEKVELKNICFEQEKACIDIGLL